MMICFKYLKKWKLPFNLCCIMLLLVVPAHLSVGQDTLQWIEGRQMDVQGRIAPEQFVYEGAEKRKGEYDHDYDRLPAYMKDSLREQVWHLSKHTAGLALRFYSNTQALHIRQKNRFNTSMPHMTGTGARGIDVYVRGNSNEPWRWAASTKPDSAEWRGTLLSGMTTQTREYIVYLPAYDGIDSLWIGINAHAEWKPAKSTAGSPIVFYGTSITQGCSASRPGMVPTNLMGRRLDQHIINLGFSGNGTLDMPLARFLTQTRLSCLVLDCTPNLQVEQIRVRTLRFVSYIKNKKPHLPVVLVGNAGHQNRWLASNHQQNYRSKNQELKKAFEILQQRGHTNLHFIHGKKLLGDDYEGTVDGVHYTDLGFMRYAKTLLPVIQKVVK
jgi:lysophospholipase L1-like esterase